MSPTGHWTASVVARRQLDGRAIVTLSAPAAAATAKPGQYASVRVGGPESARLLRRALWISEAAAGGRTGGTVDVVVDRRDAGGAWLAAQPEAAQVDVMAPLGRAFPIPRDPVSCLLVGFGTANAALLRLAAELTERGCRVRFLMLGPDHPFGVVAARRHSAEVLDGTGDGRDWSAEFRQELNPDTDVVYSAGTADQLRPVAAATAAAVVPHLAAVHMPLVCGSGTCTACALPVRGRDSVTRMVRGCTDGPVFDADLVRWADLGTVPGDCLGAAAGPR